MKTIKKCIVFIVAVICLAIPVMAYAAQEDYLGEKAGKPVCNVTFCLIDESGDYPGMHITAVMQDEEKKISDKYEFTPANSWKGGNTPKYSVLAPAEYNITFEGLEDGYTIINTLDRSSEFKITAMENGIADVYWSIISMETDASGEENAGKSQLLGEERFYAENEEAEQVFQAFLEQVEFIENDETWYNFLKKYKTFSHEEWYGKYVKDGKEEDYIDMSLFDRFVWEETYLRFCQFLNSGDSNFYFKNEDTFRKHLDAVFDRMTGNNSEQVKEAYETLAMWQFNYIKENGVPFNFINNCSYLEEVGEAEAAERKQSMEAEQKSQAAQDEKELNEARQELLNDMDKKDIEELKNDGINVKTGTASPIGIILVVVGVVAVLIAVAVVVIRNRRND